MRVLIVSVDLKAPGGVSAFYNSILPFFPKEDVTYFPIGTRFSRRNFPILLRTFFDHISFIRIAHQFDLILFNPSLRKTCFFRDIPFFLHTRLLRKPVITFIHGWDREFKCKIDRWFTNIFRMTYGYSQTILVLAEEFKQVLTGWGYKGQVVSETTTVDELLLKNTSHDFLYGADSSNKPLNLLLLSRLEKEKGLYDVVDALRDEAISDLRLVMAGNGTELSNIKKYVSALGLNDRIQFPGYLMGAEKARVLQEADVFVFPTYHGEGMPLCVLEAMAFGLPVITCAVGGIRDFFEDGVMGVLVKEKDPSSIVSALLRLSTDRELLRRISAYNYDYAKDNFYSSKVAARMLKLIKQVIEG